MTWPVPPPAVAMESPTELNVNPGQVVDQILGDGSRWRNSGRGWELMDPPGTHIHEIRWTHRVVPLIDMAERRTHEPAMANERDRFGQGEDFLAMAEGDDIALTEAAAFLARNALEVVIDRGRIPPRTKRRLAAVEALLAAA